MNKELYKWYNHLVRCRGPQHDTNWDLTNQLIKLNLVDVVKTWFYDGSSGRRRLIQAKKEN